MKKRQKSIVRKKRSNTMKKTAEKRIGKLLLIGLLALLCTACTGIDEKDNYPYEPDTPAPAAHDGVFISDYGTLTFNGDGESIKIYVGSGITDLFELPEGEYEGTYTFLSGDLPPHGSMPIRYDVAHELEIKLDVDGEQYVKVFDMGIASEDGRTGTVGVDIVTPESIPFLFKDGDQFFDVTFYKE